MKTNLHSIWNNWEKNNKSFNFSWIYNLWNWEVYSEKNARLQNPSNFHSLDEWYTIFKQNLVKFKNEIDNSWILSHLIWKEKYKEEKINLFIQKFNDELKDFSLNKEDSNLNTYEKILKEEITNWDLIYSWKI